MSILPYLYSTPHSESVQLVQILGWSSSTYRAHPWHTPCHSFVFFLPPSPNTFFLDMSSSASSVMVITTTSSRVLTSGTTHQTAPDHIRYPYISHPQVTSNVGTSTQKSESQYSNPTAAADVASTSELSSISRMLAWAGKGFSVPRR